VLERGCSTGQLVNAVAVALPDVGGWRVSLELDPQDNKLVEMHARLLGDGKPLTETWIYRWTPT
jgi:glucans biosynthesis protein